MENKLRIVFFGTSEFALPALEALYKAGYEITAVITMPDQPTGRKKIITPPPIKVLAEKLDLLILQPASLKNDEFLKKFKSLNSEMGFVAAYGKIIPENYLDSLKYGTLNIHFSLLPKYRGPSPVQSAILNGEIATGVNIIKLDKDLDHGPILAEEQYKIPRNKPYKEVYGELSEIGTRLLIETIPRWVIGEIKPREQNHNEATYTKIFKRDDGRVNWNDPAEKIYNQIRALNPEPGTWTFWKEKVLNITKAEPLEHKTNLPPGTIINVDNKIAVATSKGYLSLISIQLEGGKVMDAKSFVNGHPNFLNSKLG